MNSASPDESFQAWLSGLPPPSTTAQARVQEIPESAEVRRIRDAERVDWASAPDLDALVAALTRHLQMPGGAQTLLRLQAASLRALYEHQSAFCPIRTGGGKTLISFLAAEITRAKRPLLVVPAKLVNSGKTHREHAKARKDWRLRPIMPARASKSRAIVATDTIVPLRVISYEALGRVDYADALLDWKPDLIMFDEFHKLKDPASAVTRRLSRYIRAQAPRVLLLSGSPANRKLKEYAHVLRWALGDRTPLPRDWDELQAWGFALDEKVAEGARLAPGALLQLSPPDPEDEKDADDLVKARKRYARRLRSTPGVIASGDDLPGIQLNARVEKRTPDDAMRAAVKHLRDKWETPCGMPFEMATQLWAYERQISCGFYYRWDVPPPPRWLAARREWSAFVREILSHSRTHDSPLAVANAIDAGKLKDHGVLAAWRDAKPLFDPDEHQETVWLSDQTIDFCRGWLNEHKGICWVHYQSFGDRLSKLSGVPYFSKNGKAGRIAIDQHDGPAIASISSINEGFNLQELHCHNLVATTPTTNRENEQMISRTHRDPSAFDEVTLVYLQTLEGDVKALDQARADALYVQSTFLQPQRLCAATWIDE